MLTPKKSVLWFGLALCLFLPACANAPGAQDLERSLAPDPSLEDGSLLGNGSGSSAETGLPANFPAEIPRYPNAEVVAATQSSDQADLTGTAAAVTQTRWRTSDSREQVEQFYRDQFQSEGWQLIQPSQSEPQNSTDNSASTADSAASGAIVAERDGLRVTVAVVPATNTPSTPNPSLNSPNSPNSTEFTIDYLFSDNSSVAQSPNQSPAAQSSPNSQSGNSDIVGPVPPSDWGRQTGNGADSSGTGTFTAEEFTDVNQAPTELQPYIADLAKLGALRLRSSDASNNGQFQPNSVITRREYARWLVTANNLIYANQPARQIRLAVESDQPAFQDVPTSDPDFAMIQGLANAGLIPSPLSGDSTTVTFRPDAPLTREDLILWKVPADLRKALPNATIEAVQQTWGFQDTAQIDPKALRALLADFQNGDQSNIRRAFGYTTLFQPDKSVTRAEAAAVLWYFGTQGDGVSAKDVLQPGQQGG